MHIKLHRAPKIENCVSFFAKDYYSKNISFKKKHKFYFIKFGFIIISANILISQKNIYIHKLKSLLNYCKNINNYKMLYNFK